MSLAESTVTFGPIDQFGWRSACSGVAALIASFDQVRNGPPDAVRIARLTSARFPAPSAWKTALCSESTGKTVAPVLAARRMKMLPAQTRHSLFANATVAPRSIAASVGLSPTEPLIAAITQSAGRCAASISASSPAAASIRDPDSALFKSRYAAGSATTAWRAPTSRAIFASAAALRRALIDSTRYRSGSRLIRSTVLVPIEPVAPRMVIRRTSAAGCDFERATPSTVMPSPYQHTTGRFIETATQQSDHAARYYRGPKS